MESLVALLGHVLIAEVGEDAMSEGCKQGELIYIYIYYRFTAASDCAVRRRIWGRRLGHGKEKWMMQSR